MAQPTIAILIPCRDEELTIADVVHQFREQLPAARVYVGDNNSNDRTVERARQAGAVVMRERRQGKGFVVQSMFERVEADVYVMVDGDGTYPPAAVHQVIAPILEHEADMVVGSRLHGRSRSRFKALNRLGNRFYLSLLNAIFKVELTDILSGYRAFTRRCVKSLPLFGGGFEIEIELTIKSLARGYRIVEVPIDLGARPPGSRSKIRLVQDGFLILNTLLALFRDYKPLTFFGSAGLVLAIAGLGLAACVALEPLELSDGLRSTSAVFSVGLVLAGILLAMVGLILHTILRRVQEFDHQLRALTSDVRAGRTALQPVGREEDE